MSTVLVVDDQIELRNLFQKVLEHQGHHVVLACHGREALVALESCVPELILLDLAMPEMDGLAFLRVIRGQARWAKLPVIMLSGLMTPQQLAAASDLGVADKLVKAEFSTRELRSRVARCLAPTSVPSAAGAAA